MKEEIKASVQYGDLLGQVACDGHEGPFLHKLAERAGIPDGYSPIAASVYTGEGGGLYVHLFACSEERYGKSIEEIRRKGLEEGEIEVKKYDLDITARELLSFTKRLDIFAKNCGLENIPIVTSDPL